jgi:hypothetical protein
MSTTSLAGKARIYEAVFSSPGMKDVCKVNMHLSRMTILLLCRLIESGLDMEKTERDELLGVLPKESLEELASMVPGLLKKAALTEFYDHIKAL